MPEDQGMGLQERHWAQRLALHVNTVPVCVQVLIPTALTTSSWKLYGGLEMIDASRT